MASTMATRLAPDMIEQGLEVLAAEGNVDGSTVAKLLVVLSERTGRSVAELCRLVMAGDLTYEDLALTA